MNIAKIQVGVFGIFIDNQWFPDDELPRAVAFYNGTGRKVVVDKCHAFVTNERMLEVKNRVTLTQR